MSTARWGGWASRSRDHEGDPDDADIRPPRSLDASRTPAAATKSPALSLLGPVVAHRASGATTNPEQPCLVRSSFAGSRHRADSGCPVPWCRLAAGAGGGPRVRGRIRACHSLPACSVTNVAPVRAARRRTRATEAASTIGTASAHAIAKHAHVTTRHGQESRSATATSSGHGAISRSTRHNLTTSDPMRRAALRSNRGRRVWRDSRFAARCATVRRRSPRSRGAPCRTVTVTDGRAGRAIARIGTGSSCSLTVSRPVTRGVW